LLFANFRHGHECMGANNSNFWFLALSWSLGFGMRLIVVCPRSNCKLSGGECERPKPSPVTLRSPGDFFFAGSFELSMLVIKWSRQKSCRALIAFNCR